ncbi:hypothetical protein [Methylobacterium sp. J-092]|uniref:hypothetical protein n=1 Tax=Methylobacterium sp. J-092 TaxID=2836667 RepID=UPI00244511BE|nr:hypothetical protein [Methylobacterium sp. J-092]
MADPTVSVTAGSTAVVGTGTSFIEQAGDLFILAGITVVISSVTPGQITLAQPWPGATLTDRADFATSRSGPYWSSNVTTNALITDLVNKLDAALPLRFDIAGTVAQRTVYNNQPVGFVYLAVDYSYQGVATYAVAVKLANTNSAADWAAWQVIKASPAQATADAQAARDAAIVARDAAAGSATASAASATTATTQAGVATGAASTATSAAGTATAQAGISTGAAATSTTQAGVATSAASAAAASQSDAANSKAAAAASASSASTSATAAQAARTGSETAQAATVAARTDTITARDAAASSATSARADAVLAQSARADAASYASALNLAAFDFSFDTSPAASDDWSN